MRVRRDGVLEDQNVKQVSGDTWQTSIATIAGISSPATENDFALPTRPLASTAYALQMDESDSTVTYVGLAVVGSLTSDPLWRIQKIDQSVAGMTSVTWAGGSNAFEQVWDDRTSLTYS